MDQLKVYLGHLRKHYFWVLCAVILLLSMGSWYAATNSMLKQTDSRTSSITRAFTQAQDLLNKDYLPNQEFLDNADVQLTDVEGEVWDAWTTIYSDQKRDVLRWPAGLVGFKEQLDNLGPNEPIQQIIRETYRNYVQRDEPERLKARLGLWEPSQSRPGGSTDPAVAPIGIDPLNQGGPAGTKVGSGNEPEAIIKGTGTIRWDGFQSIFAPYQWRSRIPTDREVRYAQEDIWVYTALFDAIHKTNEGAENLKQSRAKQILALEIGKAVRPANHSIMGSLQAIAGGSVSGGSPETVANNDSGGMEGVVKGAATATTTPGSRIAGTWIRTTNRCLPRPSVPIRNTI